MTTILLALAEIQRKLKVKKAHRNDFGGFNYRSAEDIIEAVKPMMEIHGVVLLFEDEIVEAGSMLFVKSTATLSLCKASKDGEVESVSATGFAGHPEALKGMTLSQITGSASSYARKYAMSSLFLLDDSKNMDDFNEQGAEKPELTPKHELWEPAKKKLHSGKTTIDKIRKTYLITEENIQLLLQK